MGTAQVYTASEAARELGVTPPTIRRWVDDGSLDEDTTIRGRGVYVTGESVRALKAKRDADKADDDEEREA
jgi:excisionase family DNA binding protein